MKAGRMDRRITIQRREVSGKFDNGEEIFDWVDVVTCWAELVANRGQEQFNAHQKRAQSDAMFRMRYYPGILAEMRLQCEGTNYDITAVIPMRGREAGLELLTEKGMTNG